MADMMHIMDEPAQIAPVIFETSSPTPDNMNVAQKNTDPDFK